MAAKFLIFDSGYLLDFSFQQDTPAIYVSVSDLPVQFGHPKTRIN